MTTLTDVTPVTEDAGELRKCLVLGALNSSWQSAETIAARIAEPLDSVVQTLRQLVLDGRAIGQLVVGPTCRRSLYSAEPTRQQSASMTIGGRLTAVGESFAGIESAGQQITLGINVEQARWLGKYVGGEVKLTLEVTP